MTSYMNPWTGKLADKISDLLPQPNGQICDECGSPCIDNCLKCGAPQCCPVCCYDDTPSARITGDKDRLVQSRAPNTKDLVAPIVNSTDLIIGGVYGEGLLGRIAELEDENAALMGHCITLASHLRWSAKVIGAFGATAQLEAIKSAIERWERHP